MFDNRRVEPTLFSMTGKIAMLTVGCVADVQGVIIAL
jgi:hypothetical protein